MSEPFLEASDIEAYLQAEFPIAADFALRITSIERGPVWRLSLSSRVSAYHIRPGNIVSGPAMMTLIDTTAYALLIARDERGKRAVTSSLHVDFLRAGAAGTLHVQAELLKEGRRTAVVQVRLFCEGGDAPVASASTTFVYL